MLTRTLLWILLTWLAANAAMARDPANPDVGVPSARYNPVLSGQSFRPIEPLPWEDINRRVMPPEALKSAPAQGKADPKSKQEKHGPHDKH